MADDFNPYHVWLGISLKDQPANYYRLLSLDLFETSGDVIDSAADRQMAHLRTFQSGKHGELTQRLLNEVAAARVCLLDPKKRAAYDQQLRAKLAATAAAAPATGAAPQAADGSGIQRQPLRRMPVAVPMQPQAAPLSQAAATPKPADVWDDLLGDSSGKPAKKPAAKSAKTAAAKRNAANRTLAYGIAGVVVVAAAVGIGIFASGGGSAAANGTLVFDLPAADRSDTTVTVDGKPITIPADGRWEGPPGEHHVAGQRPAYKFAADVTVVAGQEQKLSPEWQPKAVLVLNLPQELRSGAELKIDGHPHAITRQTTVEIAVDPGQHLIQIIRPGSETIGTTASVEAGGRQLVAIKPPPTTATLVFDWPADERKDAELTVDGHRQTVSAGDGANPFELTVPPGKRVVRIARSGFESFRQSVELSAGANESIKPAWKAEQPATPVVETPADTAPQPVKKLAPPAAAEQERIAKQLDDLYKTTGPGAKDPAKAQALYDVAAKDTAAPAERYVLLMKGAEIAAAAGDLNLSLSGIDTLDADYEIDALELKQKLLDKSISMAKPEQAEAAIPIAEQLVDQAVAADRYDIAIVLATSASKAVAKSKIATHKEVEERLARRRHDIRLLEPIYAAAKKAQETLKTTPADAEANLTVGRWLCFYKGDWTTGLPMLAKGSDEKLKALAEQETKAPTDADPQVQIADAWWDLAQQEAGTARDSLHLHAGEIYQAAMPNLTSALKKAAIEKRLTETASVHDVAAHVHSPAASGSGTARGKQWVDLLAQVDPDRDTTKGHWTRQGRTVVSDDRISRVVFPTEISEVSYELWVEFSRDRGDDCLIFSFPVGDRGASFNMCNYHKYSGLELIDGRSTNNEANPTALSTVTLRDGQRYVARIIVKVQNENAEIHCFLDREEVVAWKGKVESLSYSDLGKVPLHHAGFCELYSPTTIYSARIMKNATSATPKLAQALPVSEKPTVSVKFPLNQWVDVLRLVDAARDGVAGTWTRNGTELNCEPGRMSRIALPVVVDGGYDFEVEFTRTEGKGDVAAMFGAGPHTAMATLSAWDGTSSGLMTLDGRAANDPNNPTVIRPSTLENGRRYRLTISVRALAGDRASVDVSLDGKPYLPHWEGKPDALSANGYWELPKPRELGLGAYQNRVTFHSARLRMVTGHASLDPAVAESAAPRAAPAAVVSEKPLGPAKFPLNQWVDVLRLVDTTKNVVEGKWSRSGDEIAIEPGDGPRIAFPVAVAGSFDLEVVFSRLHGTGEVRMQIPVGSHACDVEWGKGGNIGGLDTLDGHHSDDENNPTKTVLPDIENGHAYCLLVKVRSLGANQASIDTSIDGKPFLPHWEGRESALTVDGWWRMPTLDHLAVAAYQSRVTFSSARLRMISGHASMDDALSRTTFVGGISGNPFEDLPSPRSLLVGFNCTVVPRPGGTPVVKSIQPIYSAGGRTVASNIYGRKEGDAIAIEAKKGYAVAGVVAKGGDFVDGFKVIFMRIGKKSLDTTTSYESDWVGGFGGGDERKLGGDGEPVIGIYGISESYLNRLGLIQAD